MPHSSYVDVIGLFLLAMREKIFMLLILGFANDAVRCEAKKKVRQSFCNESKYSSLSSFTTDDDVSEIIWIGFEYTECVKMPYRRLAIKTARKNKLLLDFVATNKLSILRSKKINQEFEERLYSANFLLISNTITIRY